MASSNVIEVFIETLHGTAFELLVSPADTVVSIKTRISRLEGELYPVVVLWLFSSVRDSSMFSGPCWLGFVKPCRENTLVVFTRTT